jgi:hypothetical protein
MSRSCPQCGATLMRIHRRPIDRVVSLFKPLRRYRCTRLECEWTGNLPRTYPAMGTAFSPLTTPTITR